MLWIFIVWDIYIYIYIRLFSKSNTIPFLALTYMITSVCIYTDYGKIYLRVPSWRAHEGSNLSQNLCHLPINQGSLQSIDRSKKEMGRGPCPKGGCPILCSWSATLFTGSIFSRGHHTLSLSLSLSLCVYRPSLVPILTHMYVCVKPSLSLCVVCVWVYWPSSCSHLATHLGNTQSCMLPCSWSLLSRYYSPSSHQFHQQLRSRPIPPTWRSSSLSNLASVLFVNWTSLEIPLSCPTPLPISPTSPSKCLKNALRSLITLFVTHWFCPLAMAFLTRPITISCKLLVSKVLHSVYVNYFYLCCSNGI